MAPRLPTRRREALAEAAGWHDAESVEALPAAVLPGLRRLIGGDASGWNEIDLGGPTLRLITEPTDAFAGGDAVLKELMGEHPMLGPLVASPAGPPLSWCDAMPRREIERLRLYADFFFPNRIGAQLCFVFSLDPWIGIAINRRRDDFGAADREIAELLRSHLSVAYRAVAARQRAATTVAALAEQLERRTGAGVLVLADEARIDHASPAADALLGRWFASAGKRRLPPALAGLTGEGEFVRPDALLKVTRAAGTPVVVLEERRLAPDPGRVHALGLTRREAEVLGLVARGLTNAAIAAELIISVRTVNNHLRRAYAKLGTSDRAAAAALLMASD